MKDNLPYFSHDNNARRHPKMKALIAEFGYEGYGRFWALNERIAESPGAYIDISKKVNRLDLANELGLNGKDLDKFLAFLSDPEIDLINMKDGRITTDRITEIFSKTMEARENERNRKMGKTGNEGIPHGNNEIPPGKEDFPEGFRPENDTDKTKQDNTKLDKTKQDKTNTGASAPTACDNTSPQKLFLDIWQHTPDVFNALARIESPKEWANFWENSGVTCEQVQTALDNFIADVRSGAIELRFVPAMPDRFVLKGWITKCQKRFEPKAAGPPYKPQSNSKKSL